MGRVRRKYEQEKEELWKRIIEILDHIVYTNKRHAYMAAEILKKHGAKCVHVNIDSKKMDTWRVSWK